MINLNRVSDIDMDGISAYDAPDFVDAFICDCSIDGRPATEGELEELNNDSEFVYECVMGWLY